MELERFVTTLAWEDLRPETREMARRCLFDLLGCALAGTRADGLGCVAGIRRWEGMETLPSGHQRVRTALPCRSSSTPRPPFSTWTTATACPGPRRRGRDPGGPGGCGNVGI